MNLSVAIPARNAVDTLPRCLESLRRSAARDFELIVVDDGSTDDTAHVARRFGATVVRHEVPVGPAAARNAGAKAARAEVVLFLDADVVVAEDAVSRVVAAFDKDPGLGALFGSYDASPAAGRFVSDYRNLLHHFIHQNSRDDSESFWAGCGAVRRSVLLSLGGFDERYRRPSIEDIEFGGRVSQAGHRIRLDKRLQCTHLKHWTLWRLVQVDVRDRAYPWSRLILARRSMPVDLNLQPAHRASAIVVWVAILCAIALLVTDGLVWQAVLVTTLGVSTVSIVWLNRRFYRFLAGRPGLWFVVRAFWVHVLYYAYASATFGWAWVQHWGRNVFCGLRRSLGARRVSRTQPHS